MQELARCVFADLGFHSIMKPLFHWCACLLVILIITLEADTTRAAAPSRPLVYDPERIIYETRLRLEYADQEGLRSSQALTSRHRLGYEFPIYSDGALLLEGEYNWVLNPSGFAAYPSPPAQGRTVVADPESLHLNRARYQQRVGEISFVLGRQRINLGNQRFIGEVGWRQINQTFDATRFIIPLATGLELDYTWSWRTNRIFGRKSPLPELRRFRTDNHLIHLGWDGIPHAKSAVYGYRLRIRDTPSLSSDTFGFYVDGVVHRPQRDTFQWLYRIEVAVQTDNRHTTGTSHQTFYTHLRLGIRNGPFQCGISFEQLGSDRGRPLQTPLATLHAFNGWTDTFLSTPAQGLRDYGFWLEGPLGADFTGRLEYRHFTAARTGHTFGSETGFAVSRKLSPHTSLMLKGSAFHGKTGAPAAAAADKRKLWVQVDFKP